MSLFKKSNRKVKNQRTRVNDSDEEISHNLDSDLSRLNVKNKIITKIDTNTDDSKSNDNFDDIYGTKPKAKSNPKLSFVDVEEEDCDVFKVKKSSYSRRLAKQSTDSSRKNKKEKKKKDLDKDINEDENIDKNKERDFDDLNVIWKKSEEIRDVKTEVKEEPYASKIFAGDQIESDDEYEEEEYKSNEPFHHFRGALERGVIPDAKTIYELKKQRQMARDIDELIIPIEEDDKYDLSDSRVVRDDDNDKSDDDDEDDQRISFAINRDEMEREKNREAFLMAQEEDQDQSDQEDDSEDELDRWEREQIKKGVRMPVIQMLSQEQASNRAISGLFNDNHKVVDMDIDRPFSRPKKSSSIPSKVLNKQKYSVSLDEVIDRVRNQLTKLNDSIESKKRQIVTLQSHLNESNNEIQRLSQRREELITKGEDNSEPNDQQ